MFNLNVARGDLYYTRYYNEIMGVSSDFKNQSDFLSSFLDELNSKVSRVLAIVPGNLAGQRVYVYYIEISAVVENLLTVHKSIHTI